jgi:hypothetical protein
MRQITTTTLTTALLAFCSCASTASSREPVGWLDFHIAEEATATPNVSVEYEGRSYTLRQPGLRVGLSATTHAQNAYGFPALFVTLMKADEQRFSDWTADHVDEHLAVGVRGEVFSIALIYERLPGSLTISFTDADPARVSAAKAAIEANQ